VHIALFGQAYNQCRKTGGCLHVFFFAETFRPFFRNTVAWKRLSFFRFPTSFDRIHFFFGHFKKVWSMNRQACVCEWKWNRVGFYIFLHVCSVVFTELTAQWTSIFQAFMSTVWILNRFKRVVQLINKQRVRGPPTVQTSPMRQLPPMSKTIFYNHCTKQKQKQLKPFNNTTCTTINAKAERVSLAANHVFN